MIQIICGEKGKGKTKILLNNVNDAVKNANGDIVYLDKSNKHMYELSNKIRLINCKDYLISSPGEFTGFISGIISQDHDLEKIFLDSVLNIACVDRDGVDKAALEQVLNKLRNISEVFHVDMELSISLNKEDLPESCYNDILAAL